MRKLSLISTLALAAGLCPGASVSHSVAFGYGSSNFQGYGPAGVRDMFYQMNFSNPQMPFVAGTVTYSGTPVAGFGVLGADLRLATGAMELRNVLPQAPQDPAFGGSVSASFTDVWTVTSGQTGNPGTLTLVFDLTGSTQIQGSGTSSATLRVAGSGFVDQVRSVISPGTYTIDLPVTIGVPVPLTVSFELGATVIGPNAIRNLEFGHTARLTGVGLADDNGTPLAFSLNTESNAAAFSGIELQPTGAVPEPGTFWLAGGLAIVWGVRRRVR